MTNDIQSVWKAQDTACDIMTDAALRWQGAHMNAESEYLARGDRRGACALARESGKSVLDEFLIARFSVTSSQARDISNRITSLNLAPDRAATVESFAGEAWADKTIGDRPVVPSGTLPPTHAKASEGMFAGGDGLIPVVPSPGDEVLTTHPDTGRLEKVRYEGGTGVFFDGHPCECYTWLTGPDAGKDEAMYGRSWWSQSAISP